MDTIRTKQAAEALLRELPSVLGAFVREDVYGHPREVHLLVGPGPSVRHLARDIRDLLEERLQVPVDQRIISIAQLDTLPEGDIRASMTGGAPPAAPAAPAAGAARGAPGGPPSPPASEAGTPPAEKASAAPAAAPCGAAPASPAATVEITHPRLLFAGAESMVRDARVVVRVRVMWRGEEFVGEGAELDAGTGRLRAAATAALRAATAAARDAIRLELEHASQVRALDRDYVLVSVLAAARVLGRRPLPLVGAQPLDDDLSTATALAVLKATNRVLILGLRAAAEAPRAG